MSQITIAVTRLPVRFRAAPSFWVTIPAAVLYALIYSPSECRPIANDGSGIERVAKDVIGNNDAEPWGGCVYHVPCAVAVDVCQHSYVLIPTVLKVHHIAGLYLAG